MPFEPGKSGNPRGRPPGRSDRRTDLRKQLLPHARDVLATLVARAKKGEPICMKIFMERVLPPMREEAIVLSDFSQDPAEQVQQILDAVTRGELTTQQGDRLAQIISARCKIEEFADISARLTRLEKMLSHVSPD